MAFPFKKILCPVDFDDNSTAALKSAAEIALQNDGTVHVLHVVPMVVQPMGAPVYVDLYQGQEQAARAKLTEIAGKQLLGIKYELMTRIGEPASAILKAQRQLSADVLVIGTHGRRGFSRLFLGSVAEKVIREASCPVLTVRSHPSDKDLVASRMTTNPVTASPDEKLSSIRDKMNAGGFRSIPVVEKETVIGVVTDRDIRLCTGYLEDTAARHFMNKPVITVAPSTSVKEAARLLCERKIGGLPVIEDGKLVGIITTTDVLAALIAQD